MRLPNAAEAQVDSEKITGYLLSANHPDGRSKAEFFARFESSYVDAAWTMREVFALTTRLFLAFGIAFELPVVVVFLSMAGIVTARQLIGWSGYAVLMSFVLGAILTPADVVSQVFLAVPLVGLYFLGVGFAWIFGIRRERRNAKDEELPD